MDPNIVTMPKEEALAKFESYRDAVRVSRAAADRMMMRAFRALSEGNGILDLKQALAKGGVDPVHWLPKLAVMRADYPTCFFKRGSFGTGFYSTSNTNYLTRHNKGARAARKQFCVSGLPPMPSYSSQTPEMKEQSNWNYWSTSVPPIPPEHRPSDACSKYCILWEVDKWEPHAPPGDPILLQPIGGDLYAVLAHWDLTEVERMVLGAILGS